MVPAALAFPATSVKAAAAEEIEIALVPSAVKVAV